MNDALEAQARRLEQQIAAFEQLHADELKRFEEQLATYRRLQNDELQMLRDQLAALQDEIRMAGEAQAKQAAEPSPVALKITRRDLITGNLPTLGRK